ncbi:MAG: hypothetical protein JXB60_08930 [Candidatus Cloacimonetes bacterium]|nr:hypothetical protein [Candidatus Cloacimonadota bacterium]
MKKILLGLIIFLMITPVLQAGGNLEDKIVQFAEYNSKRYLQPLVTAFGTNLNTGFYHTAKVLPPFRFGVTVSGMLSFVPSSEKTFTALSPTVEYDGDIYYLYDPSEIETATVFGNQGATFTGLNPQLEPYEEFSDVENLKLPNGGKLDLVPLLTPQINVGLPYGNEIMIRAFPTYQVSEDTGEISFWGIGLKHSIDQYLPGIIPIDLAIQGVYQHIRITDLLTFNSFAFNAEVSKKLAAWTFYGGLQYEHCEMKAKYDYEYHDYYTDTDEVSEIAYSIEGENQFRATAGVRFSFLLFKIFTDYTLSQYQVLHAGIGLSF